MANFTVAKNILYSASILFSAPPQCRQSNAHNRLNNTAKIQVVTIFSLG